MINCSENKDEFITNDQKTELESSNPLSSIKTKSIPTKSEFAQEESKVHNDGDTKGDK